MYTDFIYRWIGLTGLWWLLVAGGYALFDYLYNTVMCWLTGGLAGMRLKPLEGAPSGTWRQRLGATLGQKAAAFKSGGASQWLEFRKDPISITWPLTILAIPTLLYGLTHTVVDSTVLGTSQAGIDLANYRIPFFTKVDDRIPFILIGIAFLTSVSTFIRYRYQRSQATFFSKSAGFNFSRAMLFDLPLAFMVLSIILVWLDYSTALFWTLSDDQIIYNPLNKDLMYGLEAVYRSVIGLSFALIVLSLLPSVMIIREKEEKYSWMYKAGIYAGIFAVLLLVASLAYRFDQRLGTIKQETLQAELSDIRLDWEGLDAEQLNGLAARLQYVQYLMALPGHFEFPSWLQFIFSARSTLFVFELLLLVSPAVRERPWMKMIRDTLRAG